MKIIILLIPFLIVGCVPLKKQQPSVSQQTVKEIEAKAADISNATVLPVKVLDGYFLKNSVKLANDVNFFTIDSRKNFDELLGEAKTMTNKIAFADLKNSIIAVIAMKPSQMTYDIKVTKAYLIGSDVYLDYEIAPKISPEVGHFISNMQAFEIQKPAQILNVSFIDVNKNITILPFGRRTAGSPLNLEAMLKYYTGRYKGTLPAADGPGISMVLTLSNDYTYRLEQIYLNNPARTFESVGKWTPSEDLSFFVLDYDKPEQEQTAFYFIDRNTVEKLDTHREKITPSSELYRLKK